VAARVSFAVSWYSFSGSMLEVLMGCLLCAGFVKKLYVETVLLSLNFLQIDKTDW